MYNNYEMAKNDLETLNMKLEKAKITQTKLNQVDASKDVHFAYGMHSKHF